MYVCMCIRLSVCMYNIICMQVCMCDDLYQKNCTIVHVLHLTCIHVPLSTQVNPSAFGGSHYGVPHAQPQQQQPLPPPSVPPPTSLPDLEPPDRTDLFLWLSKSLVGWPFVARYLGFNDEATIERIKEENPHDVSEQCYLMLDRWYRERPSRFSCRTLGEALFRSERNKHLYPEFVQRVMAQLRSQDMDTN